MKLKNNGSAVHKEPVKKRKLLNNKGYTAQASRCNGITEVEPPKNTTQGLQSLTFSTHKVKCVDHFPSINEKRDYCYGKSRRVGASLKNQEDPNDHFVQPCTRKRKLDVIYGSFSGGRHLRRIKDEKQRNLTGGKVVEDKSTYPMGIKSENFPSHEASMEYLLNTTEWNRSKNFEFGKMNNISELQAQHTGERAIESAAENSCSSVSSSESFNERDCMSLGKYSPPRHLPDIIDGNLTSYPLYMKIKDKKITSGEKQTSEVHELESLAYRSVLNALRVRGPLGWHQELLLTDLRLSLHISNDEHRLELTNMCSVQDVQL
ncbi:hypothetical protein SUGI_0144860 [Cryptomeria japonica]|uniref:uncharacterized protein LOC131027219 n=1 Tax=Cryptomeria japonica TaxID=3369 RepID=UPI002408DB90|nr:uncharacterized protein LOC131027219 [Cryptomeria japonica]GLJ11157.1 hypothetical protein SUGI_0144860 [Cryptomeria japonica]